MNYVVIDLEMCKVPKNRQKDFPRTLEVIQIGAVMLDESYAEIDNFSIYVQPQYGQIDWFISDLTGIYDCHVRRAPALSEALSAFLSWIGEKEVRIYAWSDSDYQQLHTEISIKHIQVPRLEAFMRKERWVDYQRTFRKRFSMNHNVALKEALDLADLALEGRAHDGMEDAHNTARLIEKLEHNPNYRLPEVYERARSDEEPETLKYSLGSLFADIKLES